MVGSSVNEFQGATVIANEIIRKQREDLNYLFKSQLYYLYRGGDGIEGSGPKPLTSLRLYYNADYASMYAPGRISMAVGSPLYMEVFVQRKDQDIVTVLENCYATNTNNSNDPVKRFLIQHR